MIDSYAEVSTLPEKMKKGDILTIPNFLSLFRIILVPFIIWLYCTKENYYAAFGLVVLSGLTDVLDGKIARKYNMITTFGKILDPLADKLTQAALIICLISRYIWMWALIGLFVLKEVISTALGYLSMKASETVSGAMWYGKVNTALLYAVMIVLIVFPGIPLPIANGLIGLCAVSLIAAFALYIRFFWSMVVKGQNNLQKDSWRSVVKIICACLWFVLVLFCLVYRDKITVDAILSIIPKNSWIAALVILGIFAGKSVSIFIYTGIIYAASGAFFSLPVALAVNLVGTIVMFLLPYFIGRTAGSNGIDKLSEKYPRLSLLQGFPSESKFFLSFISRIVGILPVDVVSLYFGCVRTKFSTYLLGSLLGAAPSLVTFTVMGMKIREPGSPEFLISLTVEIAINLLSLLAYLLYKRQHKKTHA